MTRRIFIWVAHPKAGSLNESLANAYEAGAKQAGCDVRRMDLSQMTFDASGFEGYGKDMPELEPDLKAWQDNITWADHVLIVHPYWWGAMPTLAKAVLDRALTPGFGFKYHKKGMAWDKLLTGKTADVIITSDTPPLLDTVLYRDVIITSDTPPLLDTVLYRKPARRVIKNQVLEFCGIKTKALVQLGSVKKASTKKIMNWLARAERMGAVAAA